MNSASNTPTLCNAFTSYSNTNIIWWLYLIGCFIFWLYLVIHKRLTNRKIRDEQMAANRKPGDWNCPKCGFVIFASKRQCLKCKVYKNDWKCDGCGSFNKQRNTDCFRCKLVRQRLNTNEIAEVLGGPVQQILPRQQVVQQPPNNNAAAAAPPQFDILYYQAARPPPPPVVEEVAAPPPPRSELNPQKECCVCMDAEKDAFFLPCGHNCVCHSCASVQQATLGKCPVCRQQIQSIGRLFQ